jgi:hypothetical protein
MTHTDIGTINEAEEIEKRDGGNDIEIDFQAEPGLGGFVKYHERATVSSVIVSDCPTR